MCLPLTPTLGFSQTLTKQGRGVKAGHFHKTKHCSKEPLLRNSPLDGPVLFLGCAAAQVFLNQSSSFFSFHRGKDLHCSLKGSLLMPGPTPLYPCFFQEILAHLVLSWWLLLREPKLSPMILRRGDSRYVTVLIQKPLLRFQFFKYYKFQVSSHKGGMNHFQHTYIWVCLLVWFTET